SSCRHRRSARGACSPGSKKGTSPSLPHILTDKRSSRSGNVYFVESAHVPVRRLTCSHGARNRENRRAWHRDAGGPLRHTAWNLPASSLTQGGAALDALGIGHEEVSMLWTIFVILVVAWLLGMVSSYTFGGFLHLLLVLAVAVVLINIIQGRRPV